ncbi:MAG: CHC2 zinc finger domain-containing protein [Oscillospiraceae bacterium]|nr:CHC2 zinc finger domain-containing protein [Oscillospiraceae bacterium]
MKVDKRFHCFACQADGDAIGFVSRLFGLPSKEAAMKLAADFGISHDSRQKPSVRPKTIDPAPEQMCQLEENHCCKVLTDTFIFSENGNSSMYRSSRRMNGINDVRLYVPFPKLLCFIEMFSGLAVYISVNPLIFSPASVYNVH